MIARGCIAVAVAVLALAGCAAEPEVVTETVEVPVEVEVVPQACIDALGHANGTIQALIDRGDYLHEMEPATSLVDWTSEDLELSDLADAYRQQADELREINERIKIDEYLEAVNACMDAA